MAVNLGHLPNWIRLEWCRKVKPRRRRYMNNYGAIIDEIQAFLEKKKLFRLDHYGSIVLPDKQRAFVNEPYCPLEDVKATMEAIAAIVGGRVDVSKESEWNPGHTVRGVLYPE